MKNKFLSFVLGICAMFALIVPKTTAAYADTTEYTVNYFDTEDTPLTPETVAEGGYATAPTLTAEDGYIIIWYTNSSREDAYNFSNPVNSDLNLYAGQVAASTITLMKRGGSYSTGETSAEYTVYDTVDVIKGGYATVGSGEEVTGYDFSHWSLNPLGSAFNFYNTPIASNIVLYPVYTIKTFTVSFYADGNLYGSKTVNYNSTVIPPTYTSATHTVVGWRKVGSGSADPVDFATERITENVSYEIILQQTSYNVSVNSSSSYYILQNTIPATITSGGTLVVELKLVEEFSDHTLTNADLKITADAYDSAVINYDEDTEVYSIAIFGIVSDLSFDLVALPINMYDVVLPSVEGLTFTVTTPAADYTLADGVYTLSVVKQFTFTVAVQEGYYAKSIGFSNCSYVSGTYSLNVRADINITSTSEVVEYYTVTFSGENNATLDIATNYLEKNGKNYLYQKGEEVSFTATANAGYYIKNVTGATLWNGSYSATVNSDLNIAFNIVQCHLVSITIPTGVENVIVTNYLARELNDYTVETGSDIEITYSLSAAYSESNITLNSGSFTNVADVNKFTVYDITSDVDITFENVVLNDCTVSLINNAMATLSADSTVNYGGTVAVTFNLTEAYSESNIILTNVAVLGNHYNYSISGNTITITMVTGDISVEIVGLEKNLYDITLQTNTYGSLESESLTVYHGDNITITPVLDAKYNRATLGINNVTITGNYVNKVVTDNIITIVNAKGDLTVSLTDLEVNKYFVSLPPVQAGRFTLSTISKDVEHGGSLTFTLTINGSCSQNADTFIVYKNGHTFEGSRNGLVITYVVEDVTEDITLTCTNLNLNVYKVDFIDTSIKVDDDGVLKHPTLAVSMVEYGTTIVPIDGTKDGYEFIGWYSDEALSTTHNFALPITANTTIYAKYEIRTYEVTFVANGITVDTVLAGYGASPSEIAPEIPEVEGYTQTAPYWDFAAVGFNSIVYRDATVHAVYTINTYTVTFISPFTTHPLKTQVVNHGADAEAPTNIAVQGYTFAYWDNAFTNVKQNIVVKAVYDINIYTITFLNGNTGDKVYEREAEYNAMVERPLDSSVVKLGYTVYGWYTDPEMTIAYNFYSSVKDDLTLYGDIDITTLTLRFVVDGNVVHQAEVNFDSNYTQPFPEIPEKKGHTIVGWSQSSVEGLTTDLDVYAVYEINTYTVTFKYSDGTKETLTVKYGTTISELPNKGKGFGVKVSANMNLLKNIDSDVVVDVKITDFSYLIYIACGVVALGLILTVVILSVRVKANGTIIKDSTKEKAPKEEQSEE